MGPVCISKTLHMQKREPVPVMEKERKPAALTQKRKLNIVIVCGTEPYELRADLLRDVLRSLGHTVTVLASDFSHIEKRKRTQEKEDYLFLQTKPYKKNLSLKRAVSHVRFAKDAEHWLQAHLCETDLVWAIIPPNGFVQRIARLKRREPSVRVVFDVVDLWPESMPLKGEKRQIPFSWWRKQRDGSLHEADMIVTECALFQKKLAGPAGKTQMQTIYLARPCVPYVPKLHLPDDRLSLCYLGSINNVIDIEAVARIIRTCQRIRPVELHIIGTGEKKDTLIARARQAGAGVIYHGICYDREKKQEIFDGCHFGLNIMKPSVCVGLSMKSLDYFEYGLPMLNSIPGDTWQIIEKEQTGLNVGESLDADKIAHYDLSMRNRARRYFEQHLTDEAFQQSVSDVLDKVFDGTGGQKRD